ncbi:MAG: restriction endonuclease subunit S [Methanobacteriota archaeon]|nr:MAG: restriction endonuclease subunit S [Euryarchaeota archaeon]
MVVNALKAGNPIPDQFAERAAHYRDNPDAFGLPDHIRSLFPDCFVDSQLGPIPEGWEVKALGDVLKLAYGKSLKASNRRAGHIPVYGSNGQVGWHDQALVPGPGIVVGRKGNPGIVKWVYSDFFPIDTTFYVVPKHYDYGLNFLFYALSRQNLPLLAADSAVPGLNRHFVYSKVQVFPPTKVANTFEQMVEANKKIQNRNEEGARLLADLRDTLLPKLISGELRVPDVEKILKDVP